MDNHYDSNVHPSPWIAPGKEPPNKYNYNDTGLGFVLRDKYN